MPDIHTLGITTAFVPPTTCLAPSNLWLTTMPCGTQWPDEGALGSPNTDALDLPICTVTLLGPPDRDDADCYGGYYHSAVNDCPVGMTVAWKTTADLADGVQSMATRCCPSAYEFATKVDAVFGEDFYPRFFCRADTVKSLSGQTVTLTVSTEPLITTEVAWDYDKDYIYAYTDRLSRHVYEGSGTTSECFGFDCQYSSNPFAAPTPTPTPTPTSSTGEAGQGEQGEATQTSQGDATRTNQGEATQASGTSGAVKSALFGKGLGPVALVITIISCLT